MSTTNKNKSITICCGSFNFDTRSNELVFVAGEEKEVASNAEELEIPLEGEWITKPKRRAGRPKKTQAEPVVDLKAKSGSGRSSKGKGGKKGKESKEGGREDR